MKITGAGEIEEVVKGKVYRIRHHLGRDPKTGRYIRSPKKTIYGTKADARRALAHHGRGGRERAHRGEPLPDEMSALRRRIRITCGRRAKSPSFGGVPRAR